MPTADDDHIKLYIPGPIEVSAETFDAMTQPMIGHRSADFQALYGSIQPGLQKLFGTSQPVFLSTSSAWGVMEGSLRNLVAKKVLCCCSGAFSDKWVDVASRCGKEVEALQYQWGVPVDPVDVGQRLATGEFDAVTLVHNETSTGVMNPLAEIAAVLAEFEDVLLIVDTVSSCSAVPIPMDELGIDVLLTGSQKALALPPGLALFSVSKSAFARAETVEARGYYFDFLEFRKSQQKDMTPSTPVIPLIYALQAQLAGIEREGLEARYARHQKLNSMVHAWVERNGFEFFAPGGFRSKTLTCVRNNREIDVPALIAHLRANHRLIIDGGYGRIKGKTFRISNMGDESESSIAALLTALDDSLAATT
ncbi:MAG: alanine--glyoxylate aminotransferase family protein [Verrucomicrobiales bacterium]